MHQLWRNPARRFWHWGPLLATFLVVYIVTVCVLFLPSWRTLTGFYYLDVGILLFLAFRVFFYMSFAVMKSPGYAAFGWIPPLDAEKSLNYCYACHSIKPPRTHHCKQCGRCILRMDHHCPWVNNCVGLHNERAFMLFVSGASISTGITFFWILWRMIADPKVNVWLFAWNLYQETGDVSFDVHTMLYLWFGLVFSLAVSGLTGHLMMQQIECIRTNTTTLEGWILKDLNEARVSRKLEPMLSQYNLGSKRNWDRFWNTKPLTWIFPFSPFEELDAGTKWPVRHSSLQYAMEIFRKNGTVPLDPQLDLG
eukprot:CAMPEP_0174235432 /NCGR_PEP_ID=MMETSP0417-20130205/4876_1 /TAXON_ID=242541 /ORGANISM="Mayorella sp, Strain BSH-02190019" /LENGTH=308 /DNA_ID=CAMNT_0015313931 /DNA_START=27 /DNA_END=949 /DNA_ORIENTATION=+